MFKILHFIQCSSATTWLWTLLLAALVVALWKRVSYWGYHLPPGPLSWPLIGHAFKLKGTPHIYYESLRKKYGDIFGLYLGTRYTVVISGAKLVKEMSMLEEFTGKPPKMFSLSEDYEHIGDLSGDDWKEQRRFILKVFRNLGIGRLEGENAIQIQISGFLDQLRAAIKEDDPKGLEFSEFFRPAINNIIFTLICNRTFQDDKAVTEMLESFNKMTTDYFFAQMEMFLMPWMKPFVRFKTQGLRKSYEIALKKFEALLEKEVERHEKNYTGVENLDYIDYYIEQLNKAGGAHRSYTRKGMLGNAEAFMLAGSDTTKLHMESYILHLINNQDTQERVYQEIQKAVGNERLPQWEDRSKMPYLQAVILEIQRTKTIVPINDARMALEDVKFGGYDLPKDTIILMNFYSVHEDKELWGDPETFRPERFLTEDGKGINHLEQYLATFSMGKRNCPGEKMATVHLFLYLTAILQAFKLVEPMEGFQHSEKSYYVPSMENFRIGLIPREQNT